MPTWRSPTNTAVGIALVNLATLSWATNMTLGRRLRDDIGLLTLSASRFLIASVIYALFLQQQPTSQRRLGSSGAMVFYNTLPLYGALLGVLLLGESLGVAHLLGGALIVGGGLWAARARS